MIKWVTVTLDRVAKDGREFQSQIDIGPEGWSQSGENLEDTRDIAAAIFKAVAEELNSEESDDER